MANANFNLIHNAGGQELMSTDIQINNLILAGDAAQGGYFAAFTTSGARI